MAVEWIVATAAGALTLVGCALVIARRKRFAAIDPAIQVRHINVRGEYRPPEVHVSAGKPARLIFRREETAPCSERVVFPDLGISVMLPPFENIAIDFPAGEPGVHPFTCQMQVLRGKLIVDAAVASPSVDGTIAA